MTSMRSAIFLSVCNRLILKVDQMIRDQTMPNGFQNKFIALQDFEVESKIIVRDVQHRALQGPEYTSSPWVLRTYGETLRQSPS